MYVCQSFDTHLTLDVLYDSISSVKHKTKCCVNDSYTYHLVIHREVITNDKK